MFSSGLGHSSELYYSLCVSTETSRSSHPSQQMQGALKSKLTWANCFCCIENTGVGSITATYTDWILCAWKDTQPQAGKIKVQKKIHEVEQGPGKRMGSRWRAGMDLWQVQEHAGFSPFHCDCNWLVWQNPWRRTEVTRQMATFTFIGLDTEGWNPDWQSSCCEVYISVGRGVRRDFYSLPTPTWGGFIRKDLPGCDWNQKWTNRVFL